MNEFAQQLQTIRKRSGYKSAKAYYEHLKKGRKLDFNYSYYMRIENGDTLPSSQLVNSLSALMSENDSSLLVQAYCQTLFPKHAFLFSHYQDAEKTSAQSSPPESKGPLVLKQSELTRRQVSALSASRETYYLFLIATLARTPVPLESLAGRFTKSKLSAALKSLVDADLLIAQGGSLSASSVESKFPTADGPELKAVYKQLDEWDQSFGEHFDLETVIHKLLIRRISFRYLSLIKGQLELLFDLLKSADETDFKYNEKVMQLSVTLKCGKIPG